MADRHRMQNAWDAAAGDALGTLVHMVQSSSPLDCFSLCHLHRHWCHLV
jgi:hypothetical protein